MDQHIDGIDAVPVRGIRQAGQLYQTGWNIEQLIILGIIKVMVMIGVGIEHAMLVMHGDTAQKPCLGKLVQRIVDCAQRHMFAGGQNLACQAVGRHMAVPSVKQQGCKREALTRWPQAGFAQFCYQCGHGVPAQSQIECILVVRGK